MERVLHIEGMHCDGCAKRVNDALSRIPGVSRVSVDLASGSARLVADQAIDPALLRDKIDLLGFTLVSVE